MLYDRWRQIAREHANEIAIFDVIGDRRWSFRELAQAGEKFPTTGAIVYPQGHRADFVIAVLASWRDQKAVCPLESSQPVPALGQLADGIAQVKLTSATSGPSRAILFSAEQMRADAENIVATMGLRRELPNLGFISLAHSYGFSNLVTPLLLHGIPLVLAGPPLPEVLRKVAATGAFTLAAVPALWQTWHEADAIPRTIRIAISAGAPLSLELERQVYASRGLKIHNFYGASECGGIAYDATDAPREDASCVGAPMRGVQLSVNPNGCLEVRSAAVGSAYFPEADDALGDGVFVTSDLAEVRDEQVYLRGRATDLINVAGRKVAPERIERELLQHGEVRDCLVLGIPDEDSSRGERIAAVVAAGRAIAAEALREFLLERIPPWQVPRVWHFVDTLPRNERGKISRAEWRKKITRL